MKPMALLFAFTLASLCLSSCKPYFTINNTHTSKMGSHDVTIQPGDSVTSSSSMTSGSHTQYTLECGGTSITIDNEELTINGVYYGKLKANETILVVDGIVSVAGVERKPVPAPATKSAPSGKVKPNPEPSLGK